LPLARRRVEALPVAEARTVKVAPLAWIHSIELGRFNHKLGILSYRGEAQGQKCVTRAVLFPNPARPLECGVPMFRFTEPS